MNIRKVIFLTVFAVVSLLFAFAQADEFKLPEGLKCIDEEAFSGTAIREVTLPESVVHVGENAFAYTEKLESVRIPECTTLFSDSGIYRGGMITRTPFRNQQQPLQQIRDIARALPSAGFSNGKKETSFRRITREEILLTQSVQSDWARRYEEGKRNPPPEQPEMPPIELVFP